MLRKNDVSSSNCLLLFFRNPPLEDMLETRFVNNDRLQSISAMYRLLRGTFSDPFEDLHEDYADLVTAEMTDQIKAEEKEKKQKAASKKAPASKAKNNDPVPVKTGYVPGMPKRWIKYPRLSSLYTNQQELCVRVMLRFSGSQKPEISPAEKSELQTYMVRLKGG